MLHSPLILIHLQLIILKIWCEGYKVWISSSSFLKPPVTTSPLAAPYILSLWFYILLDLGRFISLLIIYKVGRTPWTGDQPVARPLPTHRTTQTQNKRTQTSMSRVGFEPTTLVWSTNILLSALLSNTLNPFSSLNARDQVSHPYNTAATPVDNSEP
jgi:hypothetical protein